MPTVHLSLPSETYEELKKRAGQLGIQITDLIKLYIKLGIERGFTAQRPLDESQILELSKRLDVVDREVRIRLTRLEGKYREVDETLSYIIERIELLEDIVSGLRTRRRVEEAEMLESG